MNHLTPLMGHKWALRLQLLAISWASETLHAQYNAWWVNSRWWSSSGPASHYCSITLPSALLCILCASCLSVCLFFPPRFSVLPCLLAPLCHFICRATCVCRANTRWRIKTNWQFNLTGAKDAVNGKVFHFWQSQRTNTITLVRLHHSPLEALASRDQCELVESGLRHPSS